MRLVASPHMPLLMLIAKYCHAASRYDMASTELVTDRANQSHTPTTGCRLVRGRPYIEANGQARTKRTGFKGSDSLCLSFFPSFPFFSAFHGVSAVLGVFTSCNGAEASARRQLFLCLCQPKWCARFHHLEAILILSSTVAEECSTVYIATMLYPCLFFIFLN
jgi:hypothetical protein